jgi:hypothetical protein
MNIVLPILFFVLGTGLFVARMTPRVWCAMGLWITLVIAYHYLKQ